MEDKLLMTFDTQTTYTYMPKKKAQKKKKRSRLLKLVKSVFGFLWKVLSKVFEIATITVAILLFGVVMGIISWLEEESSTSARRNYEEEEEEKRKRKREEEEEEWREWWKRENERYRKFLLWDDYEYKIQTGQAPGPNPYQYPG